MAHFQGWNSNTHVDDEEEKSPEKQGYFARLEEARSLRRTSVDSPSLGRTSLGRTSLNRTSFPLETTAAHASLDHSATVPRSQAEARGSPRDAPYAPSLIKLDSMKPALGRVSHDTYFYNQEAQAHSSPHAPEARRHPRDIKWWSALDTGALNQIPDLPEDKNSMKSSFKPELTGSNLR
eukprot:CAMPEP_0119109718 /NCGR_PEP_ID=MMETSP1180-20130426/22641_1 /TAXON_ID=3052 ORGANISM="Chlamydomonas cf sp, Strain CCMP681" /NCGR_SAMPLE_ID=MMETSP1180 /ASSEMBLY_ACC=CAM_ASM_000741 /LENGTH=178 /DNA_ID=CAMNT_0007095635 /DNA_START=77 /DNA_END=613 /DNA_ORIENTATION=+